MEELKAKDQIRELMARYVRYADEKNWTDLASLFTPEGSFTPLNVNGQPLVQMQGRQQIAQTILEAVGQATAIHHLFSYEITLDTAEQATGIFSMEDQLIRNQDNSTPIHASSVIPAFKTMHGFGHYHANFIKIGAAWYIEKLVQTRIKLDFTY
ncbi:nuclear transport factor 2 family protein [Dyadobacter sp. CY107]|uniref:nuclear transport factor 2 family protein n=1 Tax=Dyadobacter fanqingshengii TaxID=2906443 RepID=UPI001F39AA20|nr:nuclear transport factor 2 family protein [Dyadobacter fanqingshengii]MCF2505276.1 nuclear transport factor 2 family protein [Dyadobacter fanqingshengii]